MDQERIHRMHKELVMLRGYVALLTGLLVVFWFTGFTQKSDKQYFTEIDVERINIIEADGKYRFVLTNGSRAPGAIIGGKEIRRSNSQNAPAILFYNEEGDESGALVALGRKDPDGKYHAASRLMFDRFQRDEMLSLQYYEDNGVAYAELALADTRDVRSSEYLEGDDAIRSMPDGSAKEEALKKYQEQANKIGAPRLFVGKNKSKAIVVNMRDDLGQSRLRLQVDSLGSPRMDFLDENGNITYSLPDSAHIASRK